MTKNFPSAPEAALAAIAGEYGLENPQISRVSWLETLLNCIDTHPGVRALLERDDPEATLDMLNECRALASDGMAIMELLSPRIGAIVEGNRARLVDTEIGF